jgi:hypothetical protein
MLFRTFFTLSISLFFISNCGGPMEQVVEYVGLSGGAWLKTIHIKAANDMNQNTDAYTSQDVGSDPSKLAFVFGKNEELQKKLLSLNGVDFFKGLEQLKSDHKNDLFIQIDDVLPNDLRNIEIKPQNNNEEDIYNKATFVIGFVSYQTPGDHRFTVPKGADQITLNFGPTAVAVIVPEQK